jgi:hypothetical protein
MPVVICPGCGREIDLSPEDLALTIECAVCDTRFEPGAATTAAAPPMPDRSSAAHVGLIAFGVAVLLFAACGGMLFLSRLPPSGVSSLDTAKPTNDDPYDPDCAIIRAWLKQHEGEVEVTHWGRRSIHQSTEFGGHVYLSARWRVKGQNYTKEGLFIIGPGDIVESVHISD